MRYLFTSDTPQSDSSNNNETHADNERNVRTTKTENAISALTHPPTLIVLVVMVSSFRGCCAVVAVDDDPQMSTEDLMETRRRISDSKVEDKDGPRRTSLTSGESDEVTGPADTDASRSTRAESGQERKLKVRRT